MNLLRDIRFACRVLARRPLFTTLAILALALGIGANSAMFTVVNGVLFAPLPFPESERLVMIWEDRYDRDRSRNIVSPANFLDWRQQAQSFEKIAGFSDRSFTLTDGGEAERIRGQSSTAAYFDVLGVKPYLGRTYTTEEDSPSGKSVVVITHSLWKRRFAAMDDMLGEGIMLNGETYSVIGIMPQDFQFFGQRAELAVPMRLNPATDYRSGSGRWMMSMGLLKPGISRDQAQSEMTTIAQRLERDYAEFNTGWGINLVPLHEQVVGEVRPALLMLLAAVGFVLLIACSNVSNLLLAQAAGRSHEMATRSSLGAGQRRLLGQLMTENLVLGLVGGAVGLLLAMWAISSLVAMSPVDLPRLENVHFDRTVYAYTLGISVLVGLTFGLIPGLRAGRTDPGTALKAGGRGLGNGGTRGLGGMLVVTEIAFCVMLLVCAELMLKSYGNLKRVETGMETDGIITFKAPLPDARYPNGVNKIGFYRELIDRIESLPGVEAASAVSDVPFTGMAPSTSFWRADQAEPAPADRSVTEVRWIQPGYFQLMGIGLRNGRTVTERDLDGEPRVVVINETMARTMFPGEDPIGREIVISWDVREAHEIIGVVADHRYHELQTDIRPMSYWSHSRSPSGFMYIMVRATADPASLTNLLKNEVHTLDPLLPVYDFRTMDDLISSTIYRPRFNTMLLGLFSIISLVLAAVGIYSVMAYMVSQRTREIGIRLALGAQDGNVVLMVVKQGMKLAGIGLIVGLSGALLASQFISGLLFGVSPTDPMTMIEISVILSGTAFLACYIPARRATHVDPIEALRCP